LINCQTRDNPIPLQNVYQKGNDTVILIGPEGDFSPEEIKQANQSGYQIVSLGTSRLRTETAAIVACHTVSMLNV
jgi:16S rRNA (uracil1498-N3)-methyltransferase